MGVAPVISPALERASGTLEIGLRPHEGHTVLARLYQEGCLKARFPKGLTAHKTGVLINTTGGITDGDRLAITVTAAEGAHAVLTSQAAERVYRARTGSLPATLNTRIELGEAAQLYWLPQETILFDGGALHRRFDISVAPTARLLAAEMLVLGRTAMNEQVASADLFDRWRITIGGKPAFAEGFLLAGNLEGARASDARLGGANALATLFYVGADAASMTEPVRATLENAACTAACTVRKDVLVARFVGESALTVRTALMQAIRTLDTLICPPSGMASPILDRWIF